MYGTGRVKGKGRERDSGVFCRLALEKVDCST